MATRRNKTDRQWLTSGTERFLQLFLEAAEEIEKPYAIGGALAMGVHGFRRQTADVDAFVAYEDRVAWIRALRARKLLVVDLFTGVQYRATLPGLTGENDPHIDLMLPAEEPGLSAIDEPVTGLIDGHEVAVWPASLLVIAKFDSRREKDRADVTEMYERGMFDPREIRLIMLHMNDRLLAQRFWLKYGGSR